MTARTICSRCNRAASDCECDANGWPDPQRPGVPANPESGGVHWLQWPLSGVVAMVWRVLPEGDCWWQPHMDPSDDMGPDDVVRLGARYLGPCHTPAEVAALVAAGQEAMREACAAIVDAHSAAAKRCAEEGDVIYRIRAEFLANHYAITQAADDVRVTPFPSAPEALARIRAEAERKGILAAAEIAETWPTGITTDAQRELAAAIRAVAEKVTP